MLSDKALWLAINAYSLDAADADLPFSQRLARDNRWSRSRAQAAIDGYKRFIYLVCVSGTVLTPSDDVDQVWHLHLVCTRDYWQGFCRGVLGREVHHTPTRGGSDEDARFLSAYARTLSLYRDEFGTAPPKDVWPAPARRYQGTTSDVISLPKRQVFLCLSAGAGLMLAGCGLSFAGDAQAAILAWGCVLAIVAAVTMLNIEWLQRKGFVAFVGLAVLLMAGSAWLLSEPLTAILSRAAGRVVPSDMGQATGALLGFGMALCLYALPAGKSDGGSTGCGGGDSHGCSSGGGCGGD